MGLYLINLLLALVWCAVIGSFTLLNLLFGFALGAGALYLIREQVGALNYFYRAKKVVGLAGLFIYELILSSWRVAILVMSREVRINPGIIDYPLTVDRDFEITLLANLITLTPGTLSVDVSPDRKTLYIHCIDVPNPKDTVDDIKHGFERKILEAFR